MHDHRKTESAAVSLERYATPMWLPLKGRPSLKGRDEVTLAHTCRE
jgi:hypothetical protein